MSNNIFFSKSSKSAKELSRSFLQGNLRRIYHGIYTNDLKDPIESIVKKHWLQIVPYLVPNGILSHRTAFDLKTIPFLNNQSIVFVTSSYSKTITLPGLIIKVLKGDHDSYKEQVTLELFRSNPARMLLENLTTIKKPEFKGIKTVGEHGIENYLSRELRLRHEPALNKIRDEAKAIAKKLNMELAYKKLNRIISSLLVTNLDNTNLKTAYGKAIAKKEPFDQHRIQLFEKFCFYLKQCTFKKRVFTFNQSSYQNLSFFESYFSNFIEGTKFIIDEAEDIVFTGKEFYNRHADSHDILANFYLTNDFFEMSKCPQSPTELLDILKSRHAYLMKERPEKSPGEFKKERNKAGSTYFVEPEDVIGTLTHGFELYKILDTGIARAIFMQFLISEVHPFMDGNGRIARIMMNAELVHDNLIKIIIPTVHRDNYLGGLRRATRDQYFKTYCKVMDQAQAYTQSIEWSDYGAAREKIEKDHADKAPDEGIPIFNRALRLLELSELPE